MRHWVGLVWFSLGAGPMVFSQTTFQEQTARLQNINAYLLDFRPGAAPETVVRSRFELVLDINPQPTIDARVGIKDEPLDPPSTVPKIRGRYLHRSGLALGAAYAPGIELDGYDADFYSLELGYRFQVRALNFGIRASYSDGDVTGPITEANAEDYFVFENKGLDFSLGHRIGRYHVYGFAGIVDIETSVDVASDGVHLENADDTYYGGLGVSIQYRRTTFNIEQNATDDYLQHLIFSLSYRF